MNDSHNPEQLENSPSSGETSKPNSTSESPKVEALDPELQALRVELEFLPAAAKDLKGLPRGKHLNQITAKLDKLEQDPLPHDARPIRGENFRRNGWNFYRVDVGEYRIVYDLDEQTGVLTVVTVAVIAARNDDRVYRLMERRFG